MLLGYIIVMFQLSPSEQISFDHLICQAASSGQLSPIIVTKRRSISDFPQENHSFPKFFRTLLVQA